MQTRNGSYLAFLVMLGCLFFVFGLVSWVNSILVPYFKVACDLQSEVQGYLAPSRHRPFWAVRDTRRVRSSAWILALCGSAVFPLIYAGIADASGSLHTAYWILIPAAAYMIFYAFAGHKIEYWKK